VRVARRVPHDGRHLGSEKRTPFTRPPRNRSWRPSCSRIDRARDSTSLSHEGGDRDVSGGSLGLSVDEKSRTQHRTGHQSGGRAVKRELPWSHLHRAAPSLSVLALRLRTGDRHSARRWVSEHEAKASEREHPRAESQGRARGTAAPGNDDVTGTRVTVVSECRSRSDASLVALPKGESNRARDTRPSSKKWTLTR